MNVLSLDAPLIAIVWQDFLMRCYPTLLSAPARWVLGLTVWAIYLADRLLDIRHPAPENETARHRFSRRHRTTLTVLLAAALTADVLTALIGLRPDVFSNGLLMLSSVVLYLSFFVLWRIGVEPWKHPSAAILFTMGVFLVAWTRTANPFHLLGKPAAVFCALCLGNLVLMENWEHGRTKPRIWLWMTILMVVCGVTGDSRWYGAVLVSACGLVILDLFSARIRHEIRHFLADAMLLTPLLFR
jgi:hypothetical protein